MKKNDIVMIYEDPITQERPEGKAILLECIDNDRNPERWIVRFKSDGYKCERAIYVEQ